MLKVTLTLVGSRLLFQAPSRETALPPDSLGKKRVRLAAGSAASQGEKGRNGAGPVTANSPSVLAPPIPERVPSAARGWRPPGLPLQLRREASEA